MREDHDLTRIRQAFAAVRKGDARSRTRFHQAIRSAPGDVAWEFIESMLVPDHPERYLVALDGAKRCVEDKDGFRSLMDWGLDHANASSVGSFLELAIEQLGIRYVLRTLGERIDSNPPSVEKALYGLAPAIRAGDQNSRKALRELIDRVVQAMYMPHPVESGVLILRSDSGLIEPYPRFVLSGGVPCQQGRPAEFGINVRPVNTR
ncbi:MAG: hypothetical protein WC538_06300 [Thermoanaerobaculia bacterium]|jgi:hypothetical protein